MSFRTLCAELAADEKAGRIERDDRGNITKCWAEGFGPRHVTKAFNDDAPSEYGPRFSRGWLKSFWASHARAMAAAEAHRTGAGKFAAVVKSIRQEVLATKTEAAEMRKAQAAENFSAAIQRHVAFGQKLTAEVKAGTLSAEQTSILESRWNQNGAALEMIGKRLGVR
jgi:hypothetical protein